MNVQEAGIILAKCSAYDNRQPSAAAARAWAEALDADMTIQDALTIIRDHYADSREWIMPADVNRRSREIRRRRVEAALGGATPVPDGLGDEPRVEIAWREAVMRAVGDGLPLDQAEATAWQSIGRTQPAQLPPARRPLTLPTLRRPRK